MAGTFDDTTEKVRIEDLRKLAFGAIGAGFAVVGPILTDDAEMACITNNTNVNLIVSIDGVKEQIIMIAGAYKLLDLRTNLKKVGSRTQFWVKAEAALPTSGSLYIEVII